MSKLIMTVNEMQNRNKWLNSRASGIGGSDAGTIVGLNKWKSAYHLWLEKTHQIEPENISDKEFVYWGTVLEQLVADRFCELTGKKVRKSGLLQSEEHTFMLASPDRMVVGENAGLECKTTNSFAKGEWEEDKVPASYYCQCQHYMAVTGYEKWYIAVLIGGNHFVWKEIPRNEDDIKTLIDAETAFWHHVTNNSMPEVDGSEDCARALHEKFSGGQAEPIELPNRAEMLVERLQSIKESKAIIDSDMKKCQNELCAMLGDNEVGLAGEHKVIWQSQKGRTTIDSKRLKAEKPDIFAQYAKTGKGIRVFKIK